MFKPFRYFDYCDLDVYFYMNEIDRESLNFYGGTVKKFFKIPFFRKDLIKDNYHGLSQNLSKIYTKFDNKIIFAPSMASGINFKPTDTQSIESTLYELNKYILKNKKTLIIVKEKKGELENINQNIKNIIYNSNNFFVIRSLKPKMIPYNQFEELLPFSNLLITLTSTSTTILQSLDKNIPFICVNDNHPLSFTLIIKIVK